MVAADKEASQGQDAGTVLSLKQKAMVGDDRSQFFQGIGSDETVTMGLDEWISIFNQNKEATNGSESHNKISCKCRENAGKSVYQGKEMT